MSLINRFTTTKRGAMLFTGNSLGLNNGTSGDAGAFITLDTSKQVPGFPTGSTLLWQENGSSAIVNLPSGGNILYAELQWGGTSKDSNGEDVTAFINNPITFITPSGSNTIFPDPATAQEGNAGSVQFYSRSQNVTNIIKSIGNGTYSVLGVPASITGANSSAGWTLGIIYEKQSLSIQNMSIYSGIEFIGAAGPPVTFGVSGFLSPPVGTTPDARVLVSAMEGDFGTPGDQLLFGPDSGSLLPLSGPNNLANNFFRSAINDGNSESATVGQVDTSGTFGSLNLPSFPARYGWDITNVDSTNILNDQSSATLRITTNGDGYALGLLGLQIGSVFIDYGDAPDTSALNGPNNYSTLFANNGPMHGLVNELYLGTKVTGEDDAYQNPTATGDDLIKNIQDDGVVVPIIFLEGSTSYSINLSYTNNTGSNANIYAWIDFNRDGIFQLEESIVPISVISSTTNPRNTTLSFVVPSGTVLIGGETTFMRIRITTDNLTNTNTLPSQEDTRSLGLALDGEVEDYLVTINSRESFKCEPTAYQVVTEINPNTGLPFDSQFRSINPITGESSVINFDMGAIINAIAYNPVDNYIYGIYDINDPLAGNLAKISADGVVTNLGPIPNLTDLNMTSGAIDKNGYFYIKNQANSQYFVVDLRSGSPNFGKLVNPTAGYTLATPPYYTSIVPAIGSTSGDWVFNPVDNSLYAVSSGQFYKIIPTSGVATALPTEAGFPTDFGGMFNDANGFIYGISNSTGDIIRWQNVSGTMDGDLFSVSDPAQRQDATMCINASILIDFGDAPDTSLGTGTGNYNTLLVSNGPRHGIINNLTLGSKVTSESDALQNSTATGDDISAQIQDDGPIGILNPIIGGNSTYTLTINYFNDTGKAAKIYAWVDFNRNGIFEIQEGVTTAVPSSSVNPRVENLVFNIPAGITFNSGDVTFIRTRITTDSLANASILATQEDTRSLGAASDGEVEDYQVNIVLLNVEGTVWYDSNCNGIRDGGESLAEGIMVELYDSKNSTIPLTTTTTDSNGFYKFANLPSGEYYVKVILPNGYEYTLSNVGNNDALDSDVDGASGKSPIFELSSQNQLQVIDAGLCKLNKITGQAFFDCNGNGILDSDEKLICGVDVTLFNEDGVEVASKSTDCDGRYEFTNLSPGTYKVVATKPSEMNYTTQVSGSFYGSKPNNSTGEFQVTLTTVDYLQGFLGFDGGLGLKMEFCMSCSLFCNTCSKKLETVNKSCICAEDSKTCTSCNNMCVGCKNKKNNRENISNSDNCSNCDKGCSK